MKLLLCSDGDYAWKQGFEHFGISKNDIRIGYVTTASKGLPDQTYIDHYKKSMRMAGYTAEPFNIEGKSLDEMRTFFTDKNIVHVEGGNVFYLLKAVRESGFDIVLRELFARGIYYSGSSAGSYIMAPSIETATWKSGDKDRFGVTDFTALNYVSFLVFAHYKPEMEERVREKMSTTKYPVRVLMDGQAIFVDNGIDTFVGEGKEIHL
ncbi:MAG: Type 1 glutamine amidotransferase-like domain-containing protein [bacterium]